MGGYPWTLGRTDAERAFLRELARLARPTTALDVWNDETQLIVTLDISDPERRCGVRMLRVDYDGRSLTGGNDPTMQLTVPLDPSDPDYFESDEPLSAEEMARQAFEWFTEQASRSIERREWNTGRKRQPIRRRYVIADRSGAWPPVAPCDRPPDRVARISPPTP